ncbi:MAG: hypothetical protein P9L95_10750 [Candidatus Tenebribacter mawsonii]|nr:hypothetical protein [Candidatus Tenebribacter mawsonii]
MKSIGAWRMKVEAKKTWMEIDSLEKKRKNGWAAVGLNLIFPGFGYIYCGKILLGVIVFPVAIGILIVTIGFGAFVIYPILIIDGFLAANRYNIKLDEEIRGIMKTCPKCAEKILPEAKVCKHCSYEFPE